MDKLTDRAFEIFKTEISEWGLEGETFPESRVRETANRAILAASIFDAQCRKHFSSECDLAKSRGEQKPQVDRSLNDDNDNDEEGVAASTSLRIDSRLSLWLANHLGAVQVDYKLRKSLEPCRIGGKLYKPKLVQFPRVGGHLTDSKNDVLSQIRSETNTGDTIVLWSAGWTADHIWVAYTAEDCES